MCDKVFVGLKCQEVQKFIADCLSLRVVLLLESACLHSADHTVQKLQQLCCEVPEHRPHSPVLAMLDCYLFGSLKNSFKRQLYFQPSGAYMACHAG
jgi:hypothetical protein